MDRADNERQILRRGNVACSRAKTGTAQTVRNSFPRLGQVENADDFPVYFQGRTREKDEKRYRFGRERNHGEIHPAPHGTNRRRNGAEC